MNLKIENDKERTVLIISGNIDVPAAENLKKKLFRISENGTRNITLDFKDCKSIGSSGIGAIIYFHKNFAALDGKIKIENVNKQIISLFKIIKLDNLLDIRET
jgi:anti-anti-sigma factor